MDTNAIKEFGLSIPIGQSRKTHCCGKSPSMMVSNSRKGVRGYCFRCGHSEFVPHGERSILDIRAAREAAQALRSNSGTLSLPSDIQPVSSRETGALWLLQAGISLDLAAEYKIGWSDKLQRVVLPVYSEKGELQFIQARSINQNVKPKYLNIKGARACDAIFVGNHAKSTRTTTVIVEDILSAIRVSHHTCGVSLLGTAVTPGKLVRVFSPDSTVIVWMDGDAAGRRARRKLIHALTLMGQECKWVETPKDPKEYSNAEIQETLNNARH